MDIIEYKIVYICLGSFLATRNPERKIQNMKNIKWSCAVLLTSLFLASLPQARAADGIPAISEKELKLDETTTETTPTETVEPARKLASLNKAPEIKDADESDAIKITPDKPEIVNLDCDAVNVIVGSHETLRVVPDTNRALVLIPKKPGSTYFQALDVNGKVIMRRHVIVGVAKKDYVRIRRTCAADDKNCREFSVYYCPDMCHEVSVAQDESTASPDIPTETAANRPMDEAGMDTGSATQPVPVLDEAGNVSPPPTP